MNMKELVKHIEKNGCDEKALQHVETAKKGDKQLGEKMVKVEQAKEEVRKHVVERKDPKQG